MDFGKALGLLKEGNVISRKGWNGPGQYLTLQRPDAHSMMTLPYIYITTVQEDLVPWIASQTDLLADDWEAYRVENREPVSSTEDQPHKPTKSRSQRRNRE